MHVVKFTKCKSGEYIAQLSSQSNIFAFGDTKEIACKRLHIVVDAIAEANHLLIESALKNIPKEVSDNN